MNYRIGHILGLLQSREFWEEYVFYMCYVALLGFMVQVMLLDVDMHDYVAVLGLQFCSMFVSALIFVGLKSHYQPSSYWTKMIYFIIANGPWIGLIYHRYDGMSTTYLMIYGCLMLFVTIVEGSLYDMMFDRCCDWAYRLKTLYRRRRHK